MRPRLRGTGMWLGFCGSLVLAIAAVGCGDTSFPTAEPGGSKGPEIQRARAGNGPVSYGAGSFSQTQPAGGTLGPVGTPAACQEGAPCTTEGQTCQIAGSSQQCECLVAATDNALMAWSCE